MKSAAKKCRVCPFARRSTQTVFGEGARAGLMLVGEQPGNQEDLAGKPFVGPAGRLLGELLDELGIPREGLYLTNAVKHFKFERRGKLRLHAKPSAAESAACRPWLLRELQLVAPRVIVALGATAAESLCGKIKLGENRGKPLPLRPELGHGAAVFVSWHPSAILRVPDRKLRHQKRRELKQDLGKAWRAAKKL